MKRDLIESGGVVDEKLGDVLADVQVRGLAEAAVAEGPLEVGEVGQASEVGGANGAVRWLEVDVAQEDGGQRDYLMVGLGAGRRAVAEDVALGSELEVSGEPGPLGRARKLVAAVVVVDVPVACWCITV